MIRDIYLDMDGVLSNFNAKIQELFGTDTVIDVWDVHLSLGVPKSEVCRRMEEAGHDMWTSMKPYERGGELVKLCKSFGEVSICTAPTMDPYCASGKTAWLQKFFGKSFRDYHITPNKHKLANPLSVLIDDHDKNIKKFSDASGKTILFPQPWNTGHTYDGDKLALVEDMLKHYSY